MAVGHRALGVVCAIVLFGCASRGLPPAAPETAIDAPDSLSIDDELTPDDIEDEAADDGPEDTSPVSGDGGKRAAWLSGRAAATCGPRRELLADLDLGRALAIRLRSRDAQSVGVVAWRPPGLVRRVVVGNMVLRMGERVLLGRGFVDYPFQTTRGRAEGVIPSASLSTWSGRPGIALDIGGRDLNVQSVLIGATHTRFTPGALWVAVASHLGRVAWSAAAGRGVGADGEPTTPPAASFCGGYAGDTFSASMEWATISHRRYIAASVSSRGAFGWFARVYRVPVFSAAAVPSAHPAARGNMEQGATVVSTGRLLHTRTRVALLLGSKITATERRVFRRFVVTAGGRAGIIAWEGSLTAIGTNRVRMPDAPDVQAVVTDGDRTLRARIKLQITDDPRFSHSIAIDHRVGPDWRGEGLVLIVAGRARWKRVETRWQTAGYSLQSGQGALVTRPGVGSFESFSSVYGSGSETAVRIGVTVSTGVALAAYIGEPWGKERRVYVGATVTLH